MLLYGTHNIYIFIPFALPYSHADKLQLQEPGPPTLIRMTYSQLEYQTTTPLLKKDIISSCHHHHPSIHGIIKQDLRRGDLCNTLGPLGTSSTPRLLRVFVELNKLHTITVIRGHHGLRTSFNLIKDGIKLRPWCYLTNQILRHTGMRIELCLRVLRF